VGFLAFRRPPAGLTNPTGWSGPSRRTPWPPDRQHRAPTTAFEVDVIRTQIGQLSVCSMLKSLWTALAWPTGPGENNAIGRSIAQR